LKDMQPLDDWNAADWDKVIATLGQDCVEAARALNKRIAIVESCTGGLVSAALVAVPGASEVFEAGEVAYSNAAKNRLVGSDTVFIQHGSVSIEAAAALALALDTKTHADLCLASTGITGPGGGTADKPVGKHCFAIAEGQTVTARMENGPSHGLSALTRLQWQKQFAIQALKLLLNRLQNYPA
jgi:nicotinamide-nucleotide amidase